MALKGLFSEGGVLCLSHLHVMSYFSKNLLSRSMHATARSVAVGLTWMGESAL